MVAADVEKLQPPLPLPTTKAHELAPPGCCWYEYCYRKTKACFWPAVPVLAMALAVVLVAGTAQLLAQEEAYVAYALFALQSLIACVVSSFLVRCALIIPADTGHHDQLDGGGGRLGHARVCAVAEHLLLWSFAMTCLVTLVLLLAVVFETVQPDPAAA